MSCNGLQKEDDKKLILNLFAADLEPSALLSPGPLAQSASCGKSKGYCIICKVAHTNYRRNDNDDLHCNACNNVMVANMDDEYGLSDSD